MVEALIQQKLEIQEDFKNKPMKIYLIAKIVMLAFLLPLIGCKDKNKRYKVIEEDGITIKGYLINDSIFDDTMSYFNSAGVLLSKKLYKNGLLNGISKEFYPNGLLKSQTNYSNGLKNGSNLYYDLSGKCLYSDLFYYERPVGPITYFDSIGQPKRFFFITFDNRTLFDIDYLLWKGIDNELILNLVNYSYEYQQEDSVRKSSLFLYKISPPRFFTKYSLYKRLKSDNNQQSLIYDFSKPEVFEEISLPILDDKYYYSIRLNIYDSILKKELVINREVW